MHVSIGKDDPFTLRLLKPCNQRVRFPKPTARQVGDINDFQILVCTFEIVKDCRSPVPRAIVDGDDFKTGIILREKRCNGSRKLLRFVPGRKYDGNEGALLINTGIVSASHGSRAMPKAARIP
jgi:hypothetical protein